MQTKTEQTYRCCGAWCPGLPWKASDRPHPVTCSYGHEQDKHTTTCPYHGPHNGTTGCPTCTRIRQARKTLRRAPVRSHEYVRAMAYLAEHGERGTGSRESGSVSFDLGGAA